MKKFVSLILIAALIMLTACSADESARSGDSYDSDKISKIVGMDVSDAEYMTVIDTHGGFHRDGCACVSIQFEDDSCENIISDKEHWQPLPLSYNLCKIVYGVKEGEYTSGPYIKFDDDNTPAVPKIDEGYYFFLDRHSQRKDAYDDSEIFERSSYNLTVAIYDSSTDILYYLELDT